MNEARYADAVRNYVTVLEMDWSDLPNNVDNIRAELSNARCQMIRRDISGGQWQKAISVLDQLTGEDERINPDGVQQVRREYINARILSVRDHIRDHEFIDAKNALAELKNPQIVLFSKEAVNSIHQEFDAAYGEHRVKQGKSAFRRGNIDEAKALFQQAISHNNREGKSLLIRMITYTRAVDAAIKIAKSDYEAAIKKKADTISPEQACGIEVLELKTFTSEIIDTEVKEWLTEQKIGFSDIERVLRNELIPAYRFGTKGHARLVGNYLIEIIDQQQWKIVLEIHLLKNGRSLFKKKGPFLPENLIIYKGWSIFKHIREDQAPLLRASLASKTRELITFFKPFARCRGQMLLEIGNSSLTDLLKNKAAVPDMEILRAILKARL